MNTSKSLRFGSWRSITFSLAGFLFLLALSTPVITLAQYDDSGGGGGSGSRTIIPCGNSNTSGQNSGTTKQCTFQDVLTFVSKFTLFALYFMTAVATLAILYAGYLYLTSGAVPEQRSQANGMFWKIGEAFFFVAIAYLLVKFIIVGLLDPSVSGLIFK